jgi:hypothetical protein
MEITDLDACRDRLKEKITRRRLLAVFSVAAATGRTEFDLLTSLSHLACFIEQI